MIDERDEQNEQILDEREAQLEEQKARMKDLAPYFRESVAAIAAFQQAIVTELRHVYFWHPWKIIHYLLALRVGQAYHLHFTEVMRKGIEAEKELENLDWVMRRQSREESHGRPTD